MLGEDYAMIRGFFANPGRWNLEQQTRMRRFAEVRRKHRPSVLQFFTNAEGRVEREYWGNQGAYWTFAQAQEIRDAIMIGRQAGAGIPVGHTGLVFRYADGSRVYFRLAYGLVYSILAVGPDFDPGDLGAWPPGLAPIRFLPERG